MRLFPAAPLPQVNGINEAAPILPHPVYCQFTHAQLVFGKFRRSDCRLALALQILRFQFDLAATRGLFLSEILPDLLSLPVATRNPKGNPPGWVPKLCDLVPLPALRWLPLFDVQSNHVFRHLGQCCCIHFLALYPIAKTLANTLANYF
jgi:hypothetical protein